MILWLIVNATKGSGDFWRFEYSYSLKVCSHTRLGWAWFSTHPLKLNSDWFWTVSGVGLDSRHRESTPASIRFDLRYPESASFGLVLPRFCFDCVLLLKLGKSGIVNPRSDMNCRSLVKMSVVWRFMLMCWRSTSLARTCSWMKW